jgi:hypothetical protein
MRLRLRAPAPISWCRISPSWTPVDWKRRSPRKEGMAWRIEQEASIERERQMESLFTVGNGYVLACAAPRRAAARLAVRSLHRRHLRPQARGAVLFEIEFSRERGSTPTWNWSRCRFRCG